jgi:hypothetical protein
VSYFERKYTGGIPLNRRNPQDFEAGIKIDAGAGRRNLLKMPSVEENT